MRGTGRPRGMIPPTAAIRVGGLPTGRRAPAGPCRDFRPEVPRRFPQLLQGTRVFRSPRQSHISERGSRVVIIPGANRKTFTRSELTASEPEADDRGGSNQHPVLLEREDCTLKAWYPSLYAPRAGGAYDSHRRTAGTAGCPRRRGRNVAACCARGAGRAHAADRRADAICRERSRISGFGGELPGRSRQAPSAR